MKKTFHTPDGVIIRELTKAERDDFAAHGDKEAVLDREKENFSKATTLDEKIRALEKAVFGDEG